jgi:hypothetical protein
MPAERLTMRKIQEVFRQKFDCDISNRQIAVSCNIAHSTVGEYLFRFKQAALSWPLPQDIDDNQLEQLLYPQLPAGSVRGGRGSPIKGRVKEKNTPPARKNSRFFFDILLVLYSV